MQLRTKNKIIIFESNQLLEIAVRQELLKISGQIASQLLGGLIVRPWKVKRIQLMQALNAFTKNSAKDIIRCRY